MNYRYISEVISADEKKYLEADNVKEWSLTPEANTLMKMSKKKSKFVRN